MVSLRFVSYCRSHTVTYSCKTLVTYSIICSKIWEHRRDGSPRSRQILLLQISVNIFMVSTWLQATGITSTYPQIGNPYHERKIVLDKSFLGKQLHDIEVYDPASLRLEFLKVLESECAIARANQQQVLTLIFGHGEQKLYGIWLGGR